MNLDSVIFIISAAVTLFGAVMMIMQRNPVAAVLYFILSLVAQAVLYVQLGALFVGAVLIIVYSGAILVLFLFVIMLLNLRGDEDLGAPSSPVSQLTKYIVSIGIIAEFAFVIWSTVFSTSISTGIIAGASDNFGSTEQVAKLLFGRYLYPFELTSILLLAAIVGAVVIARKDNRDDIESKSETKAAADEVTG